MDKSDILEKEEADKIIKQIQCLDGEQFDSMENRCLPCTHYGLVWDSEHKVCKPMLKQEIIKEQDKNLFESGLVLNGLDVVSDEKNNIIGLLEKTTL